MSIRSNLLIRVRRCAVMALAMCVAQTAALATAATAGSATSQTISACDRLAADPGDPRRRGAGVAETDVDPGQAIPACQKELARNASDPRLLYQLARAYLYSEDPAPSLALLQKASALNYPAAQAVLAEFYLEGEDVPQDDQEAARLYRAAAAQGIGSAQVHLAGMYIDGRGVEQSDVTGIALLHQSADGGFGDAQMLLGQLYLDGGIAFVNDELVPRDLGKAAHYLKLAAAQGYEDAADLLLTLGEAKAD